VLLPFSEKTFLLYLPEEDQAPLTAVLYIVDSYADLLMTKNDRSTKPLHGACNYNSFFW